MPDRTKLAAEFGGTAFLLAVIVGSGVMGQRLADGNAALALLANSMATGAGLYAIISILLPISGAHLNPLVSAVAAWRGQMRWRLACQYALAQFSGAVLGVISAHLMFGLQVIQSSASDRTGAALMFAEFVAVAGLLAAVSLSSRRNAPAVVATYITAAYWFTASTSFANPAVTVARALTASFSGIGWPAVPGFLLAQSAAAVMVAVVGDRIMRARPHRA